MARQICEQRYNEVVSFVYGDTDSLFLKTVEKLSVADAIKYVSERLLMTDLGTEFQGK